MAAVLSPSKVRSATVFGVALTELFILLLMVVIFLWAATAQHDRLPNDVEKDSLRKRLEAAEAKVKETAAQLAAIDRKLKDREQQLQLLWQVYGKHPTTLEPGSPDWEKKLDAWMKDVQKVAAEGGRGHANCLTHGAVMKVVAEDAGISSSPLWEPSQVDRIKAVPGLQAMASGSVVPLASFTAAGEQVLQWSDKQSPKCRFDVLFVDRTTQKSTYAASLKAVERVFYKSDVRQ